MAHYKIANLNDLESRARQALDIIRDRGMEIVDPFFRACDREVREAYLYGLKNGIFTPEERDRAQCEYQSERLAQQELNSLRVELY